MLRGTLLFPDVYVLVGAARRGFKMVVRPTAAVTHGFTMVLFTEPVSRRSTFVGGTCAPPSALLVGAIIHSKCEYSLDITHVCHFMCSVLRSLLLYCGPLLTASHLSVRFLSIFVFYVCIFVISLEKIFYILTFLN